MSLPQYQVPPAKSTLIPPNSAYVEHIAVHSRRIPDHEACKVVHVVEGACQLRVAVVVEPWVFHRAGLHIMLAGLVPTSILAGLVRRSRMAG